MEPHTDNVAGRAGSDHHTSPRAATPPLNQAPEDVVPAASADRGRSRFTLRRSRTDRMLGGVCGGLAASLDVDAALVRIGVVVLTIVGSGLGALVYLAAWIVVPEHTAAR